MFRIKKDDYNTVQFMPDYKSGENRYKKQKPAPAVESIGSKPQKARARRRLIITLIIIAAVCIVSWYVYSHYFTQEARFIRDFNTGSYSACEDIAKANTKDSSFKNDISDTVTKAADKTLSQFKSGKTSADDAISELNQYNKASAELFDSHINDNINVINSVQNVYALADQASTEAQSGNYEASLKDLQQVVSDAQSNDLNLDDQVTKIITDNLAGFKEYLFGRYAVVIRWSSDFSSIKDSATFITTYVKDDDFTNFLSTVSDVENNKLRRAAAASTARQVVKNVQAQQSGTDAAAADSSAAAGSSAAGAAGTAASGSTDAAGTQSGTDAGQPAA